MTSVGTRPAGQPPAPGRTRNRRGQGSRLREEILAAATRLLEQTGNEDAITLRAVAREVGISAPSIYAHFDTREAIVRAVVAGAFAEFMDVIEAGTVGKDAAAALHAGCQAYLDFAVGHPERYRVLFGRTWTTPSSSGGDECDPVVGQDAFALLVTAIERCRQERSSASEDAVADATALWVGMHGLATLRSGAPDFLWPEGTLTVLVDRLARLRA